MLPYILIVITSLGQPTFGQAVAMHEFTSNQTCLEAKAKLNSHGIWAECLMK